MLTLKTEVHGEMKKFRSKMSRTASIKNVSGGDVSYFLGWEFMSIYGLPAFKSLPLIEFNILSLSLMRWCTIRWTRRRGCRCTIITWWSGSNTVGIWSSFLLLSFVANKVDLRFTGLCWCWRGNNNVWLFIWLLNQHIDQCLLFSLWQRWNVRCCGRWWWRSLYKHNFVVFLWWRHCNGFSESEKTQI